MNTTMKIENVIGQINNKLIHRKDSTGYECWQTCDENNNNNIHIHHKYSTGYESRRTYDENNKLIHRKDSDGNEESY